MANMMSNGQAGWMVGGMWFFPILFWVLVIAGAVFIARWMMERHTRESPSEDSPMNILKRRYAQGEINQETFERMQQDLGDKGHKNNRNPIVGVSLLLAGVIGLGVLSAARLSMGGTMGGGMMDRHGMKEMMKGMMGGQLPPGMDPKALPEPQSRGAQLLAHYCTQCHDLPGPGMHTAAEWPPVLERMNGRMQMMVNGMMGGNTMGIEAPSGAELQTLTAYLQAHAQIPMDITKYPDLSAPDGKVFSTVCRQCHALPDPTQHTAREWSAVVMRMKKNMSIMKKNVPDEIATQQIVGFLQRHARVLK